MGLRQRPHARAPLEPVWRASWPQSASLLLACSTGSLWALVGMSVATVGIYGMKGPFWPLPSTYLSGMAAAASIAAINSIGNLGGLIGPLTVGWIKDRTGSFLSGPFSSCPRGLGAAVGGGDPDRVRAAAQGGLCPASACGGGGSGQGCEKG